MSKSDNMTRKNEDCTEESSTFESERLEQPSKFEYGQLSIWDVTYRIIDIPSSRRTYRDVVKKYLLQKGTYVR